MVIINKNRQSLVFLLTLSIFTGCSFFEPKIFSICEDVLKNRLQSPTGYMRDNIRSYEEKMTMEEYEGKILSPLTDKERENFNTGKASPTRHILFIEYDAPNIYGTPIRDIAICEYFSQYGKTDYASVHNVRVNGQTNSQWLLSHVR